MKKYLKSLGYTFGLIIFLTLFITLLNYIGIVSGIFLSTIKIIIPVISIFLGGLIVGKNSSHKGWLNGLKLGLITIGILVTITLLLDENINLGNRNDSQGIYG